MSKSIGDWHADAHIGSDNVAWVDALYERWLAQDDSVPPQWARYFNSLANGVLKDTSHATIRRHYLDNAETTTHVGSDSSGAVNLDGLVGAYRQHGYRCAHLDPLNLQVRGDLDELNYHRHNFSTRDLEQTFDVGDFQAGPKRLRLRDAIDLLKRIYCGNMGVEVMYMPHLEERKWLLHRIERAGGVWDCPSAKRMRLLELLIAAEGLEQYLAGHYPGTKRFGLEGAEVLIPVLDEIIYAARPKGVMEVVMGMAHRGRLNVLVNILGKNPADLFQEFEGNYTPIGAGDVKYHQGFSSNISTEGGELHLALSFNPSHLEMIGPVVQGSVRARQDRRKDSYGLNVLPILVHGDAAFAAQGVVMESFQMSRTRAHRIGGTIHIVLNNQVGFTTSDKRDARSTEYCTDVAKLLGVPVFHVNGDDPEAAVFAAQLALDYRQRFHKDVVIDLVCYRRLGHNEADEPRLTQPVMYKAIKAHPSLCRQYVDSVVGDRVLARRDVEAMRLQYRSALKEGRHVVKSLVHEPDTSLFVNWSPYLHRDWNEPCDTNVSVSHLREISKQINTLPEGFREHPIVNKLLKTRHAQLSTGTALDWGCAETLAYATLLSEGHRVRLVGQDSRRGTFSHRHAVICDQDNGNEYIPLKHLGQQDSGAFMLYDSLLSELGALGFEYGYAATAPDVLTIWEAQFGDFGNAAQVIIDQFLSSGERKWGRLCGLTLLLPHGYEGQGAEHSSARLERFMQLCAEHNMQVCVPSEPVQMFHLLRRQILRPLRKPLTVMTPKRLLRHPEAVSSLRDFAQGGFVPVIGDSAGPALRAARRLVLCSGKVYYDLVASRKQYKRDDTVIMRLEQLYPFPEDELHAAVSRYKHLDKVIWCQEEPRNQGAWYNIRHRIMRTMDALNICIELSYVGRPPSAAAAVGSTRLHEDEQARLVAEAMGKDS